METPTPFDLNEAIRRWRIDLPNSPVLRAAELAELEGHLRDSTLALQGRGLPEEEAFLIASQRLGQGPELAREFAKVKVRSVWMDRAAWMIAGISVFALISWCAAAITGAAVNLALPLNAHWIGFLSVFTTWFVQAAGLIAFGWFVIGCHQWLNRVVHSCLRRPLLPFLGMVFLSYNYPRIVTWFQWITMPTSTPDMKLKVPILNAWTAWGGWIEAIFWMAAFLVLIQIRCRTSQRAARKAAECTIVDLESPLRDRAQALLTKGLSEKEAVFLVTRSKHPSPEPASTIAPSELRGVWIDRFVWMLAGILFNNYLLLDLYLFLAMPTVILARLSSVNGHLLGFVTVSIQWVAMAGLVVGLWRFVTRHETRSGRIVRFCIERPVLGVIAFVILHAGFWSLFWLIGQTLPATQDFTENSILVSRWNTHGHQFLYNVIVMALLFWLARRQLRPMEIQPASRRTLS